MNPGIFLRCPRPNLCTKTCLESSGVSCVRGISTEYLSTKELRITSGRSTCFPCYNCHDCINLLLGTTFPLGKMVYTMHLVEVVDIRLNTLNWFTVEYVAFGINNSCFNNIWNPPRVSNTSESSNQQTYIWLLLAIARLQLFGKLVSLRRLR